MQYPTRALAVATTLCTAAALAFAPIFATAAAAEATTALEPGVDASVKPGDDFFAFANGAWLQSTAVPAGRERWGVRHELDQLTRRQIAQLFEDAAHAPAGTLARQVADFRRAYADEAAIEARGLAPLAPWLERIAALPDKVALARCLGADMRADVDPLNRGVYRSATPLGLAVEPGLKGEKINVVMLLQGGLGLPAREPYLAAEPPAQTLRAAYRDTIARMLTLAGLDRATQRADAVLALEIALAESQATSAASAAEANAGNLWTRADFAARAPGLDWAEFFAAAGLAKQENFVAWQPGAVTGLAAQVAAQPLAVWQDYLRFHALNRYADVLPRAFADATQSLRELARGGSPSTPPRAERALAATQEALSEAVSRLFVERHFPAEHKARVAAIARNVIAAFRHRVEAVAWMTPRSKATALAKLDALYFGVGYPEKWPDFSALAVDPADALGNLRRIEERDRHQALARVGQPVDATEWWIAPHAVGAVLTFQQNAYNFAAALLQPTKFDPAAPEAMNYGAIGAIIGHEVSHFVDTLGADYEADGRMRHWWTAEDHAGYDAAVQPLIAQFSSYRPLPDAAVNGKLTLTENLADLGGLCAAFDAHRLALGSSAADPATVRQRDREFFLGFARSWRGQTTERGLRTQIASDVHAPESCRIATVRNHDAWYAAFDVRPGDRLYLAPNARLRIW